MTSETAMRATPTPHVNFQQHFEQKFQLYRPIRRRNGRHRSQTIVAVTIVLFLPFRRRIMACLGRQKPPIDDGPAWLPVHMPPQTQSVSQTEDFG
ncbi:hypothetical protein N7451_000857 [Penicillium sp. IBT 35674x]|nr:hypothetical protein N7451_000857 [Penicillium sp. IBT 35674x]